MGKLTQDFRPGLYYTAPAGLARCWRGAGSEEHLITPSAVKDVGFGG